MDRQIPASFENPEVLLRMGFSRKGVDGRIFRLGGLGSSGLATLHAFQGRTWRCFIAAIAIALLVHVGEIRVVGALAIAFLRLFPRSLVYVGACPFVSLGFAEIGHFDNDVGLWSGQPRLRTSKSGLFSLENFGGTAGRILSIRTQVQTTVHEAWTWCFRTVEVSAKETFLYLVLVKIASFIFKITRSSMFASLRFESS